MKKAKHNHEIQERAKHVNIEMQHLENSGGLRKLQNSVSLANLFSDFAIEEQTKDYYLF